MQKLPNSNKNYWKRRNQSKSTIVYLENAWNSKQMITEGEAAIPLERLCTPSVIKRKQNKDKL